MSNQIAMIGLGRMGGRMAIRLHEHGFDVVGYDSSADAVSTARASKVHVVTSIKELTDVLQAPRLVWLMVPSTGVVDVVLKDLLDQGVTSDDLIVDAGNSDFRDTVRRSQSLRKRGVHYLDVGTSGGLHGAEHGCSFTVGGDTAAYVRLEPFLAAMAAPGGYVHVGPTGVGHFVKMVHNAIEYGMMAAFGEGLELLAHGPYESLDLVKIAHTWNQGSILRSYLLEAVERLLGSDPRLDRIAGYIEDTGLGRVAVREALACDVPFSAIADSLFARLRSRQDESFAAKVIAGLRHEFGGHDVRASK